MSLLTSIQLLKFAAAGALVAMFAANTPARADELVQNLGPVGPHQPILTTVGNKRVVAFYAPDNGHCGVQAVVWNSMDNDSDSVARLRISLKPGQKIQIDSADNKSLNLQCGDDAVDLAIANTGLGN